MNYTVFTIFPDFTSQILYTGTDENNNKKNNLHQ